VAIVEGVKSGNAVPIATALRRINDEYPKGIIDTPFLTNHDQIRIATVVQSDPGKLRNAAAILLTLPGTPFVYYGEEIGMVNGPTNADEWKRTPMRWTPSGGFTTGTPWYPYTSALSVEEQIRDSQSLLSYYRKWISARKSSTALMKGDLIPVETAAGVLGYIRNSGSGERALVLHNLTALPQAVLRSDLAGTVEADAGVAINGTAINLPPHSSGVWTLR
jgi:alpha-amylase